MKVGRVSVKNFQSYRELEFDYSDLGLALVHGETGSGKSTMMDAVAWILFGITSKDSAADDVRAWDGGGPTEGHAEAFVGGRTGRLTVFRVRAPGKNDLYWYEGNSPVQERGKDMADTQRLLEKRLGVTADLFLVGSYLTQFSKADSFFVAKAKERRETLEQIADQSFAVTLGERTSEARKVAKKEKDALDLTLARETGRLDSARHAIKVYEVDMANWTADRAAKIVKLRRQLENFAEDQAATISAIKTKSAEWQASQARKETVLRDELARLEAPVPASDFRAAMQDLDRDIAAVKTRKCASCGNFDGAGLEHLRDDLEVLRAAQHQNNILADKHESIARHIKDLKAAADPHLSGLQQAQRQANPYGAQLEAAAAEVNPYVSRLQEAREALKGLEGSLGDLQAQVEAKNALVARLGWLYDKSFELRGLLMARVVSQIEASTNAYLERFFDAALRVTFTLADSDKLEVEILNNGHIAPFKALSGGERCLLKLCFSLSLMKAAQDKAGVDFGMILLDEAFNGLSDSLKVRAFGLLQQLEQTYGTVLVIDHSPELKAQFSKVYLVDKTSGNSQLHEQSNHQ